MKQAALVCIEEACGARYGIDERIYVCPLCAGLLEIRKEPESIGDASALRAVWTSRLTSPDALDQSGVWRYRELLPFTDEAQVVSLAEGNTPLYDAMRAARYCGLDALKLKHQGCNPTGSFKDTGMTVAVTQALKLSARTVVCASTGNTAASLAAYAARARLSCAILVPRGQVSHAKLAQSLDYGAMVLELEGGFDDAMRLIRELAEDESIYLVNSINPFRIEGQKTVAAELVQQLGWRVPDHLVVPGGNLGNSSAFGKGLIELLELGLIDRLPKIHVVQAAGAAPFANLFAAQPLEIQSLNHQPLEAQHLESSAFETLLPVAFPQTLATAIQIGAPVSWRKALRVVRRTGGRVLSVSEQEMADAKAIIGRDGVGCEPASATTIAGIRQLVADGAIGPNEEVVAVLTGHVLKDTDYVINYHNDELFAHERDADGSINKRRIAGRYANPPARVKANSADILEYLRQRRKEGDE
ncbi:MAG TPA: threonine synthase [Pyrinomonadaceae bacterium]|jgi:threonine synthase